jgi:hypothetical protein
MPLDFAEANAHPVIENSETPGHPAPADPMDLAASLHALFALFDAPDEQPL